MVKQNQHSRAMQGLMRVQPTRKIHVHSTEYQFMVRHTVIFFPVLLLSFNSKGTWSGNFAIQ